MARLQVQSMPVLMRARAGAGSGYPAGTLTPLNAALGFDLALVLAGGWEFPKLVRALAADGTVTVLRTECGPQAIEDP